MLRLLTKTAVAVSFLFALSACYVTDTAVLSSANTQEIPGIEGTWQVVDGDPADTLVVARVGGSNEYEVTAPQEAETLSLHGFNLIDDVYMVEIYDPNAQGEGAILAFVRIEGDSLSVLTPTGDPQVLAGQAGVDLGEDSIEVYGEPAAVLQFVQLHADAAFTPQPMLTRAN